MHFDTDIYQTVERLGDALLAAGANMPRNVKPLLGGRLFDETVMMALLIRNAAIARGHAKVPYYDELLQEIEATQFMLKRAFANRYLSPSAYSATLPLTESVARQANGLRSKFVSAP